MRSGSCRVAVLPSRGARTGRTERLAAADLDARAAGTVRPEDGVGPPAVRDEPDARLARHDEPGASPRAQVARELRRGAVHEDEASGRAAARVHAVEPHRAAGRLDRGAGAADERRAREVERAADHLRAIPEE